MKRVTEMGQVDYEAAVVRLEAGETKNDEPREFPFTNELKTLLEAQGAKADALLQRGIVAEYVFFNSNGQKIRDFRKSWKTACRQAGLAEEVEIGKAKDGSPS